MKNILKTFAFTTLLFANTVFAATPENGWWWNPAQSGTGYNIETQNGTVFIATFVYDEAGNPVWYSGSGKLNRNNIVSIKLARSSGGQCLGCAYTTATTMDTEHILALTFDTESTATVNLDGATSQIERFDFNYGSGVHRLLGIWSIVLTAPPGTLGSSDTIGYVSVRDDNVIGFRVSDTSVPVVAKMLEGGENYLSITPVSANEKLVLFFSFHGLNRIGGLAAIVGSNANSDEIFNALASKDSVLTDGFRFLPPPTNTAGTASAKQVSSSSNKIDVLAMLEELDKVAAIIQAEGFTPKFSEVLE